MRYLYVLLVCLSLNPSVFGCSCVYIQTFCETITYNGDTINSNYLIVRASVESKFATGMQVKVIDVLFGTPKESVLTIVNGNGADCRMSTSGFVIGDQHIFALFGESEEGFNLYECGVTTLTVVGNEVTGAIAPGISHISLEDLLNLDDCGNLGTVPASITVRPTLTSDIIKVETTAEVIPLEITMYDMTGRIVFSATRHFLTANNPLIIQAGHFASGCYAIVIKSAGVRQTFKVVIAS